jgi:GR25 family glycosyltransferase involved in LPS biosynthesis
MNLNVYLIYTETLENRKNNINSTLETIKNICNDNNINFKLNIVNSPNNYIIDKNVDEYNKRVDFSKFPDDNEYNNYITSLNSYQISNYEKHREAFKHISDTNSANDVNDTNDIYMIVEDDIIIGKDYLDNIKNLIKNLDKTDWDILFTSLNIINDPREYIEYKSVYKKLISKSCYFIRSKICKILYESMYTFKLRFKHFLCKFINDNDYNVIFYNKNTFIEGSKIGIYPTSVNPNNYLYFNYIFIELSKILNKEVITNEDITKAKEICANNNFDSPDFLNVLSAIYLKNKDYDNAKKYSMEAVECLKKNNGYLQKNSEILNNSINIWQYEQDTLDECKKFIPKY